MLSTTHFNLNIVEGTDLVNPLTQLNPNFQAIDDAMYANEMAAFTLATELKSGTIHALTRTVAGAGLFRFVATSDFTAGDTFTLDGNQVTALTTDGQPLTTGSYRIGMTVLAAVTGTVMTLFVSSGTVATAADSERLGGELPAYYATAANLQTVSDTATAAGTLAGNAIPKGAVQNIVYTASLPDNPISTTLYLIPEA